MFKNRHTEETAAVIGELSYVKPDSEPTTMYLDHPDQAESETIKRSERLEGSIENAGCRRVLEGLQTTEELRWVENELKRV